MPSSARNWRSGAVDLIGTEYAGSYLLLIGAYAIGMVLVWFYREEPHFDGHGQVGGRSLKEIIKNPIVTLAVCSSAAAYGVMTFLMTATPISMHEHSGHSLEATKVVIQSHIIADVPAFHGLRFSLFPIRRREVCFGWGVLALVVTLATGLSGISFSHYIIALSLLGIGWNFLFLTGTNLLVLGHEPSERFRVQSFNDFLTFSVQAMVSLGSGWVLFAVDWNGLLWAGAVPVIAFSLLLLFTRAWPMLVNRPEDEIPLVQADRSLD